MRFTKMQAIGNDYVYVDCFKTKVKDPSKVAKIVSDRHFGIGADGLILICPSDKGVRMDMYNADGSRGEMCGNGARSVAKYAYDHGYVTGKEFVLETLAGDKYIQIVEEKDHQATQIRIDMGEPKLTSEILEAIEIDERLYHFIGVDMGNPHAVYYVDSLDTLKNLPLEKIGPAFENHARFVNRVNSEFIYIEDENNLHMRVWERGSGETLACGTGASASGYATYLLGKCKNTVNIHLLGGDLQIEYDTESKHIFMTGPARYVFEGEIAIDGEE